MSASAGSVLRALTTTSVFSRRWTRATLATVIGTIAGMADSAKRRRSPVAWAAYRPPKNSSRNHGAPIASVIASGTTMRADAVSAARV